MQQNFEQNSQNFAPIKCRILQFIEIQSINREIFFKKIGASKSNFAKSALKSEVSATIVSNIVVQNPELSAEWLLTGEGQMLKNEYSCQDMSSIASDFTTPYGKESINDTIRAKDEHIRDLQEQIRTLNRQLEALITIVEDLQKVHKKMEKSTP